MVSRAPWDCRDQWGCRGWQVRQDLQDFLVRVDPRVGLVPREREERTDMWASRAPRDRRATVAKKELEAGEVREDTEVRRELQAWTPPALLDLTDSQSRAAAGTGK